MTVLEFRELQEALFNDLLNIARKGQLEYAGGNNAFGNFERLAGQLNLTREQVLWVYFMKHVDGIVSYLNGYKSQREPIQGRIGDAIVYLTLLYAMVMENDNSIQS